MWNLLIIIFLASGLSVNADSKADSKAESSFYEPHHSHHPPHGLYNDHSDHHINSVSGYYPENQQVNYEQPHHVNYDQPQQVNYDQPQQVNYEQPQQVNYEQPQQVNIEQQQPVAVRQVEDSNNGTSIEGQPGGYWPVISPHGTGAFHRHPHHPGYWTNGAVAYRTDPPNPPPPPPPQENFGFLNGGPVSTTSATPTRNTNSNTVKSRERLTASAGSPSRSNQNKHQTRKSAKKKSQTLPKRKSQPTKMPHKKRKLVKSLENGKYDPSGFNFSYIPEELFDKGSPIHPTLEIVRDEQGIPIVVPVFRPIPEAYNKTASRNQNKKNQNERQQLPPQFFHNAPGFGYTQGPFTIQLSPFVNPLNNPLSDTNGFVPRDVNQETANLTGQSYGLNIGWTSVPIGPFPHPIHPLVHPSVPYPYSHFGVGPFVYTNATQTGEAAQKSQKPEANKEKAKVTTTKNKDEDKSVTEEKNEENKKGENETSEDDEIDTNTKNSVTNGRNKDQYDDDDYEEDEVDTNMKNMMKNIRNQIQDDDDEDGGNEVEDESEEKVAKPIEDEEENYVDTEEVSEEISPDVLRQMIQEYNEKNQDTPIIQEGDQVQQQVVERLRNQIQLLLNSFNPPPQPEGRNKTAEHIDWTQRLRDRYQLKTRPLRT